MAPFILLSSGGITAAPAVADEQTSSPAIVNNDVVFTNCSCHSNLSFTVLNYLKLRALTEFI